MKTNVTKKNAIGFVILIVLIAITFLLIPGEKEEPVKIGYLQITGSHLLFIANNEGFFEEQGIDVELIRMQSSNQLAEALLRGDIDVSVEMSAVPILKISEEDPNSIKIFLISKIYIEDNFDAIIVDKESEILTLKDLENKKIATFPGSTASTLLKQFLESKDIDISTITFVPMPPPTHLSALSGGSVDAVHAYEPTISIAESGDVARKIYGSVYSEQINPSPQGVATISERFITENPDLANRIVEIFLEASTYLKENVDDSREILLQEMGLTEEVVAKLNFYERSLDEEAINSFKEYVALLELLEETSFQSNSVESILYSP
jgi:NitT/TauT family transport system substrate-binding protein